MNITEKRAQIEKLKQEREEVREEVDRLTERLRVLTKKIQKAEGKILDQCPTDFEDDDSLLDLIFTSGPKSYRMVAEWVESLIPEGRLNRQGTYRGSGLPGLILSLDYRQEISDDLVEGLLNLVRRYAGLWEKAAARFKDDSRFDLTDGLPVQLLTYDLSASGIVNLWIRVDGTAMITKTTYGNMREVVGYQPLADALRYVAEEHWYQGGPERDDSEDW